MVEVVVVVEVVVEVGVGVGVVVEVVVEVGVNAQGQSSVIQEVQFLSGLFQSGGHAHGGGLQAEPPLVHSQQRRMTMQTKSPLPKQQDIEYLTARGNILLARYLE